MAIRISENDTPWEVACKLINATYTDTHKNIKGEVIKTQELMFYNSDLRRIANHLYGYLVAEESEEQEDE